MDDPVGKFFEDLTGQQVMVFLTNGVRLVGKLEWFEGFTRCFGLSRDGITQIVMNHAVATIMPDAY
jgi:RNA chaperone Hfq